MMQWDGHPREIIELLVGLQNGSQRALGNMSQTVDGNKSQQLSSTFSSMI